MALLRPRRRRRDRQDTNGIVILLQRYAVLLLTLGALTTGFYGMFTYYAKAEDVDKKFSSVVQRIELKDLNAKKERYEDELFRLRLVHNPDRSTRALIDRYQSKLNATEALLRDLQRGDK